MSEVQSRPAAPRGRGSARGGRGGFSSRGGRGGRGHATNGDKTDSTTAPIEDDGEVGQLKKKYGSKVTTIKEMFPDWTDEDVVFALQETDGDLETTVDRITDGMKTPERRDLLQALSLDLLLHCLMLTLFCRHNYSMGRGLEEQEGSIQVQGQGGYNGHIFRRFYQSIQSLSRRSSWI